jgi:hypothetical protein
MTTAETIRYAVRQAHHWRDTLWQAVIEDLEQRNPTAAQAVLLAIQTQRVHLLVGSATQGAVLAWPHLDAQSRQEWIWACQYIQQTWLRDYLS